MNRTIGKKAPDFHLKAVSGDGEDFSDVGLDTYRRHQLVLFSYPMDLILVCPTEITTFSNSLYLSSETDAKLLAVNTDSEYTHQAWVRNGLGHIGYSLGADKTLSMAVDYGVSLEDQGAALRSLFIIDLDQAIHYSVIHDNNTGRSTQEVLRVLKTLQTGSLYGANWTIGSRPLKRDQPSFPGSLTSGRTIRIYTLPDYSCCRRVKELLVDSGISYEEIDLDSDVQGWAFMDSRSYTALPVTVIGSHEISGFRFDKIRELLL